MKRYWVPSNPESAIFGTKITDRFFDIDTGGDLSFFTGTLKHMIERGWTDDEFIERHTERLRRAARAGARRPTGACSRRARAPRAPRCSRSPRCCGDARTAVFVWSMGVTQHVNGEDNVRAIINLALSKGFVGREKCGLMPIRGHSGVQGGAEMGAYCDPFPGPVPADEDSARELSEKWGFDVPAEPGLSAAEMVEAGRARRPRRADRLWRQLPRGAPRPRPVARGAPGRIPLRVHMDLVLSPQMLVEPRGDGRDPPGQHPVRDRGRGDRDEHRAQDHLLARGGGPRVDDARPSSGCSARSPRGCGPSAPTTCVSSPPRPSAARSPGSCPPTTASSTCARPATPSSTEGPMIGAGWKFDTDDGHAHFTIPDLPPVPGDDDRLRLSTRRGKQFNSMVQEHQDALTGVRREAVLMSEDDAVRLGLVERRARARAQRHRRDAGPRPHRPDQARERPGALAGGQRADRDRPPLTARRRSPTTTPGSRSSRFGKPAGRGLEAERVSV